MSDAVAIRVRCTVGEARAVSEALTARGWGTQWIDEPLVQDTDDEGFVLHAPAPDAPAVVHAWPTREGARPEVPSEVLGHAVDVVPRDAAAEATDWSTAWREAHAARVEIADGWVLCPPWQAADAGAQALVIEPGGAFGTGAHPTTRDSLAMLRASLAPGARVLDLGAGSGVLAIAAARWGAGEVVAVDIQDDTAQHVAANARLNALAPERVRVVVADVADAGAYAGGGGGFDVVLCNVGAAETERVLPLAGRLLAPGGALIASGIFAPSRPRIESAARRAGLRVEAARESDGWVTLALRAGG